MNFHHKFVSRMLFALIAIVMSMSSLLLLFQQQVIATESHKTTHPSFSNKVFHEGGAIAEIELIGNYAISTEGSKLMIFDISDPSVPIIIGQTPPSYYTFLAIERYGNYIFAANNDEELIIFDITNKTDPQQIASQTVAGLRNLYLDGDYLFAMHKTTEVDNIEINSGGFRIFDISNPESLVELTNYTQNIGGALEMVRYNNYLYVSVGTDDQGLRTYIFDITTLNNPLVVTNWSEFTYQLEIYNDTLIAVAYDGLAPALSAYNLDDPTAPTLLSNSNDYVTEFSTLAIENDVAYVATRFYVRVFDLTDLSNVNQITSNFTGGGESAAVKNNTLFLGSRFSGLAILEFQSNTLTPVTVYRSHLFSPNEIDWVDEYLYIKNDFSQLAVLNGTDKNFPTPISDFFIGYSDIEFAEGYAFVADAWWTKIYDFSNPISPTLAVELPMDFDYLRQLTLLNNTMFVTDDDYLKVFDITSPISPTLLGQYQGANWSVTDFTVDNQYLYLAENGNYLNPIGRLTIFEPSGTLPLQEYGFITTTKQIYTTHLYDNTLFLGHPSSISIIDVSNRNEPLKINAYPLPNGNSYVNSMVAKDDLLVYATGQGELAILDISDLNNIVHKETLISGGSGISEISENRGNLYVASVHNGLIIFENIFSFEDIFAEDHTIYLPLVIAD